MASNNQISYQDKLVKKLASVKNRMDQTEKGLHTLKLTQGSKNLKQYSTISLAQIMNYGRENQFINHDMVQNMGNGFFAMIAVGKRLFIIDTDAGKLVQKNEYER